MWRRSLCGREKSSKSKVSADLGQKWMCVSVSAEWQYGNGFTPGVRFSELSVYIFSKDEVTNYKQSREF